MGRKARTDTPSEVMTLRLSEDERQLLQRLQAEQGLTSRSETVRWAIQAAARGGALLPEASGLARRLRLRTEALGTQPLGDDEVVLAADEVRGVSPADAEALLLPALADLITRQVALHGWFYPISQQTVSEVLLDVQKAIAAGPHFAGRGRVGVPYLQSRIRAFWETRKGPVEATASPQALATVLRHLLGLSTAKRAWDVSLYNLRKGMGWQLYALSFFRPTVAAGVYRRWLGDVRRPRVWDPSAGFGARMLGFFAAYPEGTYVAHEPAKATYRDLHALAADMPGSVELHRKGSEFADWAENEFDMVFTSPPYFDTERYFDEPGQAWVEYPEVSAWRERQVYPTLREAAKGVKPGGFVVINISHLHRATFVLEAERVGLKLHAEDRLLLHRGALERRGANKSATKYEPILVFQKPKP
jgi:hypothetical protein